MSAKRLTSSPNRNLCNGYHSGSERLQEEKGHGDCNGKRYMHGLEYSKWAGQPEVCIYMRFGHLEPRDSHTVESRGWVT